MPLIKLNAVVTPMLIEYLSGVVQTTVFCTSYGSQIIEVEKGSEDQILGELRRMGYQNAEIVRK